MSGLRTIGIVLLVGGVLGLIYGGFSYTRQTHEGNVGPIAFSVNEKERVNVPLWLSLAAALGGGALLAFGKRD